jgi:RHS repeat-associated protein
VNYVYADELGTPRAVANSVGAVVWQWGYQGNPWGEMAPTSAGGYALNLRFAGQYYDQETGQVYNANRYYDAPTGRYIQSDPIGQKGGVNTYAYVGGHPLLSTDPFGLAVGDKYSTIDDAATNALDDIIGQSIRENREYAGVIYQNWDGTYSYTEPNAGGYDNSYPGDPPLFHKEVADYHTHGGNDEDGLAEKFSDQDINSDNDQQICGYIETPQLAIKRYKPNPEGNPWMGTITTLRKGVYY